MIKAILFDFNGVIIDDEPIQMSAYKQVMAPYGIELTDENYYAALGMDDRAFVRAQFAREGKELTEEAMIAVIEAKSEMHHELIRERLPLFVGVETLVRSSARFFDIGIVSMARRVEVDYVLERSHLNNLFKVIVSAEEVSQHKPDPACYRRGIEKLNLYRVTMGMRSLLAGECLAIEDAPPGIESARAAGMRTLGITNTVSSDQLRGAGADVVSTSLADWTVEAIRRVFGH
jgi:HAD superfamily hydrolase (TIGR01509 family)